MGCLPGSTGSGSVSGGKGQHHADQPDQSADQLQYNLWPLGEYATVARFRAVTEQHARRSGPATTEAATASSGETRAKESSLGWPIAQAHVVVAPGALDRDMAASQSGQLFGAGPVQHGIRRLTEPAPELRLERIRDRADPAGAARRIGILGMNSGS